MTASFEGWSPSSVDRWFVRGLARRIDDYDGEDDVNNDDDGGGRYCSPETAQRRGGFTERSRLVCAVYGRLEFLSCAPPHRSSDERERLIDFLVFYCEKHVNRPSRAMSTLSAKCCAEIRLNFSRLDLKLSSNIIFQRGVRRHVMSSSDERGF